MATLDSIRASMNANSARISEQTARINDLQVKIDRLEAAKVKVNTAHNDAQALEQSIKGYDPSALWAGTCYNSYDLQKADATSKSGVFVRDINDDYNAICDKITELKNQQAEGRGIIGWCQTAWNNLSNEWSKLWHSLFG